MAERVFDKLAPRKQYGDAEIDPYFGHATPESLILRGRVLSRRPIKAAEEIDDDASRWANFKAMMALFRTREIPNMEITCLGASAVSDEEGYFELSLPLPTNQTGWVLHEVSFDDMKKTAELVALSPSPAAEYGIVSDIDDTLIKTDAWSLRRNLWNSLTGNVKSRIVFPDAVELLQTLYRDVNPVFYVSSSPWNLHGFLNEIFDRAGLVRGPKFLRDLGISEKKFITDSHGHHKGSAIDEILNANPTLSFILLGDTGQHDAQVYYDAIVRHPGRIKQVILRDTNPRSSKDNQSWIDKIIATDTPLFVGETYESLLNMESLS
jgi:phosphatidate phosphatase APP1